VARAAPVDPVEWAGTRQYLGRDEQNPIG
jgi:hypothetical protein